MGPFEGRRFATISAEGNDGRRPDVCPRSRPACQCSLAPLGGQRGQQERALSPRRWSRRREPPSISSRLLSVEDDALGEELQVIWEIEPGATVIEKVALPEPTGFDAPDRLDAFLDAVRWGAASTADVRNIQSPFRSGIDIEDYQLDPVVRAIQMPRVNLLIADDVGLGQDHRVGPGRPRTDHPPPGSAGPCRLPGLAPGPVAGPDAGQVRARLPHRR